MCQHQISFKNGSFGKNNGLDWTICYLLYFMLAVRQCEEHVLVNSEEQQTGSARVINVRNVAMQVTTEMGNITEFVSTIIVFVIVVLVHLIIQRWLMLNTQPQPDNLYLTYCPHKCTL